MKKLLLVLFALLTALPAHATESIEGEWLKSDGSARIRTWLTKKGELVGKITWVKDPKRTHDTNNPDQSKRKRKLLGLQIISGFKKDGKKYSGGRVYNTKNGKNYKGKIWNDGNDKLMMRGFVGVSLLGSTAEWKRHKK